LNLCDRRLELPPDFAQAMDPEVLTEDVPDLDLQRRIPPAYCQFAPHRLGFDNIEASQREIFQPLPQDHKG
jgi:hypothetical protein